eukprot:3434338-Alexandrium_andersonii.AAC.1
MQRAFARTIVQPTARTGRLLPVGSRLEDKKRRPPQPLRACSCEQRPAPRLLRRQPVHDESVPWQ